MPGWWPDEVRIPEQRVMRHYSGRLFNFFIHGMGYRRSGMDYTITGEEREDRAAGLG